MPVCNWNPEFPRRVVSPHTPRASVAPRDYVFGMMRMYGAFADPNSENVMVFKDVDEAMRWLGLISVFLTELHGECPSSELLRQIGS